MIGVIVLATAEEGGLGGDELLADFLGAPILTRAIAAGLPPSSPASVVVVVPEGFTDRVRADAVDRFGLDEVDAIIPDPGTLVSALQAALEALPDNVESILIHEAQRLLVPGILIDALCDAVKDQEAVLPVIGFSQSIFLDDNGAARPAPVRDDLRLAQGPVAIQAQTFRDALNSRGAEEEAARSADATQVGDAAGSGPQISEMLMRLGITLNLLDGDEDNFRINNSDDVSRALEVFSRRAVDYAFVYPKEFLPDDPLAAALGTQSAPSAENSAESEGKNGEGKSDEGAAADESA
jgi:2-C-methyl-D-erythritol 4-phosphate cytidylyltransferase